ncbi:MAG: EAL domain-containing protein, partial [Thermoleophilia bacterium]|nr:EAL domain-containing protein [Thermoleophilia bacterium]
VTGLATIQLRSGMAESREQRLSSDAEQTSALFGAVGQSLQTVLSTGSAVATATDGQPEAFDRSVSTALGDAALPIITNASLLDLTAQGARVVTVTGGGPVLLDRCVADAACVDRVRATAESGVMDIVVSDTIGGVRTLGITGVAGPGSRYAVYSEISVPAALSTSSRTSTGIVFAVYLGRESPDALLITTSPELPIGGERLIKRIQLAGQQFIAVFASYEATGFSATFGPWILLAAGTIVSIVLALLVEGMRRRRNVALGLVEELLDKNTELDASETALRHQALHDPLTDLPNRTLFRDRISQEIARGLRAGEPAAVMMVDLDRFKEVNDTLGHQSGDALLLAIGHRLRSSVRASDTVARLGGDEFGVLAPGVGTPEEALALAAALNEALATPVSVAGLDIEVAGSIGIAIFPRHGDDVETLIRHADVALYRSKESHTAAVYDAGEDHYSPTRLKLLTGLRQAIATGEIVVAYQPQAGAATRGIRGVEALVRWEHPELGLIMPDEFIPLAEHTDLIRPLTFHVLDTAVAQCAAWRDAGWDVGVAVNVTGRDILDATFPDDVIGCLRRHGVAPDRLELEITENTIFSDPPRASAVLSQLSDLGVRIAIDDFGAGNSSLGYLARLPVDVLKIDKSFVLEMGAGGSAAAIVRSTIELGHNLGLEVIAEGVETEELLSTLVALRCDSIQGFLLGRAMPAGEVEGLFGVPRPLTTAPVDAPA